MFVWTSGGPIANDVDIDEVNISNATAIGIEENKDQIDSSVYPNPGTGISQVYFKLNEDAKVTVDVLDVAGRSVLQLFSGDLPMGEQYLELDKSNFQAGGVY